MMRMAGLILILVLAWGATAGAAEETLEYGRFGRVTLYRKVPRPSQVVLFVSGDGGWNLGVVDMARSLAGLDTLVVGIDITHYLRELAGSTEKCSYPAADFENLSKFIQKRLGFPRYRTPVLVGYSSGATLVYALLAQAPPNTFRGAISMGFCPDLPLNKPLCAGHGLRSEAAPKEHGYNFLPSPDLAPPLDRLSGDDRPGLRRRRRRNLRQTGRSRRVRPPPQSRARLFGAEALAAAVSGELRPAGP